MAAFFLTFSAFLLVLVLALRFVLKKGKQPKDLPLGSMGWPFLGQTLAFLKPHRSDSIGTFLQQHCSRYGRVFKSHLFGSPAIVSCDYELNTFILQNEGKLFQIDYPKVMHDILGKFSLFTVTGDVHKQLRNVAVSFIAASKSTPNFLLCVEKLSSSMMDSWQGCKEIGFYAEVKKLSLNIMVKYLLSIEPEEPVAMKIGEYFQTYMKGFVSFPLYIPGTPYANAVKARERLTSTVREILKRREKDDEKQITERDFLDVLLSKQTLSIEGKVGITLDVLLGGHETSAVLLSLIAFFLAKAPHAYQTLKEEHQAIREKKEEGEPLNWEDYLKMEFSYYVICEALRCGNVVKFLHRKALQDIKFKDYFIPSGWKVLPILGAVHLDPFLHENPGDFNPWRWADKTLSRKVMPFGGGPRLCPGAELAKVMTAFFLHHLVLRYRWMVKWNDDYPVALPYVEFVRGLLLEMEPADE